MTHDPHWLLQHSDKFPFDQQDEEPVPHRHDWAYRASRAVIASLTDRRDIKYGFANIDLDVRLEIVSTLAETIRAASGEEAAHSPKGADTQRAPASHPYPPEFAELIEAAEMLRDDMVQRAEMNAHQNAGEVVVEASRSRWDRFQAALVALTGEEG